MMENTKADLKLAKQSGTKVIIFHTYTVKSEKVQEVWLGYKNSNILTVFS